MANEFGDTKALMDEKNNDGHKYKLDGDASEEMHELVREMSELNSWYNDEVEKLAELAETEICSGCLHEIDDLMNSWIADLTEQNGFLLDLNEETQEEGIKILQKLERNLSQAKNEGTKIKLEKQQRKICVDNLLYERSSLEKHNKKIQEVKEIYKVKTDKTKENILASEKQISNLRDLTHRLEINGIWDIQGLKFDEDIYDQLFGENPDIIGGPCPALYEICRKRVEEAIERETLRMDIRVLNDSIKNKNKEIDEWKEKLDLLAKNPQTEIDGDQNHAGKEKVLGIMQTTVDMTKIFGNQNKDIALQSDEQGFTDEFLKL